MPRILLIEDEQKLQKAISRGLAAEGYEVAAEEDGNLGLARAMQEPFDAVILDVMLPGRGGIEVLDALRAIGMQLPVLILSARGEIDDRVLGLDAGADDYLAKPFAWSELLARLRACLRRQPDRDSTTLHIGQTNFDQLRRRLVHGPLEIELTVREAELLEFLIRRHGQTLSRTQLATEVWQDREAVLTNVIDVFVNQLRKKLAKIQTQVAIHTVRGVGYVLRED